MCRIILIIREMFGANGKKEGGAAEVEAALFFTYSPSCSPDGECSTSSCRSWIATLLSIMAVFS